MSAFANGFAGGLLAGAFVAMLLGLHAVVQDAALMAVAASLVSLASRRPT